MLRFAMYIMDNKKYLSQHGFFNSKKVMPSQDHSGVKVSSLRAQP